MDYFKLQEILDELIGIKKLFKTKNEDADFTFTNGKKHYEERIMLKEIDKTMTYEEYVTKARNVSFKSINGNNVKAYKYSGNRIAKTDGSWFVSYTGGKGGTLITAFPLRRGMSRFYELMDRDYGIEIKKE